MIKKILAEVGHKEIKSDNEFLKRLNNLLKGEKLDLIINDFWKYRENIKNTIQENYPNLIKQLTFLFLIIHDLNEWIRKSYEARKDKEKIKYRINVCGKLFNKSLQTFIDIFGLLENGSVMNTYVLWRTIYENFVVSKYLIEGTENEANLFNEYEVVQSYKLLNEKITPEQKEIFINKYSKDFNNDYSWAVGIKGRKSFIKIIRKVKEKKYYKFYLYASYIGHSSSFSVNRGIIYQDKTANTNMVGYNTEDLTISLNTFITLMCDYAYFMIDNFIDNKNDKTVLKTVITHYGRKIDRNWKPK